jgi:two-component sensor histidine kinase
MPMAQRSSPPHGQEWGQEPAQQMEMARESDHRIANNLQLLMAMIAAERRDIADPQGALALDRMLGRIGAIAGVHRQLTRPEAAAGAMVEIGGYLQALVRQIESGCCDVVGGRRLTVAADTAPVPARMAAAIGLIASECVLNACKYAYPVGAPGEVRIDLRLASAQALRLTIEDDGVGAEGEGGGFGTRLVDMLAGRIGGALLREATRPGTRIVLAVPL